jgi:hypothetical protein
LSDFDGERRGKEAVWVVIEVGAQLPRGINRGKKEKEKGVSGWRDLILELIRRETVVA